MGSFKRTKLWKSTVSLYANEEIVLSTKESMRSSFSCQELHMQSTSIIKEASAIFQQNGNTNNKIWESERRTLIASTGGELFSESRMFMIKVIMFLAMICLPGNIFALTILYKHDQSHNTSTHSYENITHSPMPYHTDQDPIEFKNISSSSSVSSDVRSSTEKVKNLSIVIM